MLEFIKNNYETIITIISGALVAGQGFFVVFKNLKVNYNFNSLERTVERLVNGDIENIRETVTNAINDFKQATQEINDILENFKKEVYEQNSNVVKRFDDAVIRIETKTKNEINRIDRKVKDLLIRGDVNEDVSNI